MVATLTVTSDKQMRAQIRAHTISENAAGPPNGHSVHKQHTHTHTSQKAAAKVAVLKQTGGHVHTDAHTPDDSANTCCRHNIHLANAPERRQRGRKTRMITSVEQNAALNQGGEGI